MSIFFFALSRFLHRIIADECKWFLSVECCVQNAFHIVGGSLEVLKSLNIFILLEHPDNFIRSRLKKSGILSFILIYTIADWYFCILSFVNKISECFSLVCFLCSLFTFEYTVRKNRENFRFYVIVFVIFNFRVVFPVFAYDFLNVLVVVGGIC